LPGLRVITARNPVHAALYLVLAFFSASGVWMLLQAEFLAIALVLVYVGAVMVLFLFVVMMLDINLDRLREGFWSYLPLGAIIALLMVAEMALVLGGNYLGLFESNVAQAGADTSNVQAVGRLMFTEYVYPFELASVILLVGIVAAVALTQRGSARTSRSAHRSRFSSKPGIVCACCRCPPRSATEQTAAPRLTIRGVAKPSTPCRRNQGGTLLTLSHFLILGAILFAISVVGIFLNRKNLIIILMSIELMLLAVNMNFIAFSHYLQDLAGQVFVFFILTVAAAESAIGLAILVVLFRNLKTIHVDDLDSLKG
jgi:NADH-quinone oxidoreductase subunit J